MPDKSFLIVLSHDFVGNDTFTLKHVVARNERLRITGIFMDGTGIFNVIDLSDDSGTNYANCNASNPIPSTFFQDPDSRLDRVKEFIPPIEIAGGDSFNVGITDTSGAANTVRVLLQATRIIPQ
jgi:hypothetical protein